MRDALKGLRDAFSNRSIRRLQLAEIGSTTGMWAYSVALAVFAYEAGGAAAVGIVIVVRMVPTALFAPFLALLSDRHSRRRVMLVSDLVATATLAGMTIVALTDGPPAIVYALAACSSIAGSAFTPARAALLPSLAHTPQELTAANTAASTIESVGAFAGPAIGGVLVGLWDPAAGFLFTGLMYAWSALNIWWLPADAPPGRLAESKIVSEASAGIRMIWSDHRVRLIIGLYGAQTLVAGALDVLVVVIAFDILAGGEAQVGVLYAALGVGGLLGAALVLPMAAGQRLAVTFAIGNTLWALPLIAVAISTAEPVALMALTVVGIGNTIVDVAALTLLQRAVPDEVLARVFGAMEGLLVGTIALGGAMAPVAVSVFGPEGAAVAFGAFLLVATAGCWTRLRSIDRAAEPPSELGLYRRVPFMAPLPEPVLEHLAGAAEHVTAQAGEAVVSLGETGDRFYVIEEGEARVETPGGSVAIRDGDFFGEIALLRDVPRTATVRAVTALKLLALDRDEFIGAVTGHAPSASSAEAVVARRLEDLHTRR